jgi:hypothetical protein
MTTFTGDFHIIFPSLTANVAAIFLVRRDGALAGDVGASFRFFLRHDLLLDSSSPG